jgi:hypothetical protein
MRTFVSVLSAFLLWGAMGQARAGILNTVNWAPDNSVDGTGTGVLVGTNTVTYTTAIGFNAGETFPNRMWATSLGTAGATGGGVTFDSGGALGGSKSGTTEKITFSSAIANPVLLVDFLGGNGHTSEKDTFDFGSNSFALLSSHNAVAVGNVVSSTMAHDTIDDGFGIQFAGAFGPGNPLQFTYTSDGRGPDGLQTVGFTIGVAPTAAVPEPCSLVLCGIGGLSLLAARWRRRQTLAD